MTGGHGQPMPRDLALIVLAGAGTSPLSSFPAGATQSANGMQILVRAA